MTNLVCVCLDFLKPKTRINEKVGNKMRLAEPKTRFIYGPLRSINENALLRVFIYGPLRSINEARFGLSQTQNIASFLIYALFGLQKAQTNAH